MKDIKKIKKSYEMVKYNNDLNYMPLPKFTGKQMDLFFAVISQIKDENKNANWLKKFFCPKKRQLIIPYKNFVEICRLDNWKRDFIEIYKEIENFLKMLLEYKVEYETKRSKYFFVCFEEAEHDKINQTINITFQARFYDMVINHKYGFTIFELQEFTHLRGTYTKKLYQHLKQFRHTGKLIMTWKEFLSVMDIPDSYKVCDIDKQILKPALRELQTPYKIVNENGSEMETRIPFKDLKYTKKKKYKGKNKDGKEIFGRDIVGIEFTFKNQKDNKPKIEYNTIDDNIYKLIESKQNQYGAFYDTESIEDIILAGRYSRAYINSILKIRNSKTGESSKVKLLGIDLRTKVTIDGLKNIGYAMHLENLKTGYIQKNQILESAEHFKNYILAHRIDDDVVHI